VLFLEADFEDPPRKIVNGMPVVQKGLWAFDSTWWRSRALERRIEGQRADLQPLSAGGHWVPA
jgi:hypothetical protein